MTGNAQSDDFDVGKALFDLLKELPPERQQRLLRWVAEGLGVSLGASPAGPTPPHQSQISTPPFVPPGGGTDIKTFMAAKSPKSDNQFAAAVAYFYRFEAPPAERRDSVTPEQLQEAARLAGRKRLGNPRATLNNAKAMGYLDSGARGEFVINSVGENLVAMTLPDGVESPVRKKRGKGSNKSKKKGAKKRAR